MSDCAICHRSATRTVRLKQKQAHERDADAPTEGLFATTKKRVIENVTRDTLLCALCIEMSERHGKIVKARENQ